MQARDNLQSVLALRIPGRVDTSPDSFQVPLSSVASAELAGGSGSIRHIDQDLVVTISGNVTEGQNPNDIRSKVQADLNQAKLPDGINARIGGAQDEEKRRGISYVLLSWSIPHSLGSRRSV